jgi:hypothetical protein
MRGARGIVVAVVTVCVLATSVARAQVPAPPAGRPVPTVPRERPAAAAYDYETGRIMRTAGIVLVSLAGVVALGGVIAVAADPAWRPPPRCLCDDHAPPAVVSIIGGAIAVAGVLFFGVPGAILWINGSAQMKHSAAAPRTGGLSIGPGPVGSQGLSLRWRF